MGYYMHSLTHAQMSTYHPENAQIQRKRTAVLPSTLKMPPFVPLCCCKSVTLTVGKEGLHPSAECPFGSRALESQKCSRTGQALKLYEPNKTLLGLATCVSYILYFAS